MVLKAALKPNLAGINSLYCCRQKHVHGTELGALGSDLRTSNVGIPRGLQEPHLYNNHVAAYMYRG